MLAGHSLQVLRAVKDLGPPVVDQLLVAAVLDIGLPALKESSEQPEYQFEYLLQHISQAFGLTDSMIWYQEIVKMIKSKEFFQRIYLDFFEEGRFVRILWGVSQIVTVLLLAWQSTLAFIHSPRGALTSVAITGLFIYIYKVLDKEYLVPYFKSKLGRKAKKYEDQTAVIFNKLVLLFLFMSCQASFLVQYGLYGSVDSVSLAFFLLFQQLFILLFFKLMNFSLITPQNMPRKLKGLKAFFFTSSIMVLMFLFWVLGIAAAFTPFLREVTFTIILAIGFSAITSLYITLLRFMFRKDR